MRTGDSWLSGPRPSYQPQMRSEPSGLVHVHWRNTESICSCIRFDCLMWLLLHLGSHPVLNNKRFPWSLSVLITQSQRSNDKLVLKKSNSGHNIALCEVTLQTVVAPPTVNVFPSRLERLCLSSSALSRMLGNTLKNKVNSLFNF